MTHPVPDPDAMLMGGGVSARAAKWPSIGHVVAGIIASRTVEQQTEYIPLAKRVPGQRGKPLFWDEARTQPKWQVVITLQTDARDDEKDTGLRRVFVKGGHLQRAIQQAVKAAGATNVKEGGRLALKFVGTDDPNDNSAAKQYLAHYTPPREQADEFLMGAVQPEQPEEPVAQVPSVTQMMPAAAQAPAPASQIPAPVAEQVAATAAAAVTPEMRAAYEAMDPAMRQALFPQGLPA